MRVALKLARALGLTPGRDGVRLELDRGRWWLRGCREGDRALPQTHGAHTMAEAIERAEAWLAPEVDKEG